MKRNLLLVLCAAVLLAALGAGCAGGQTGMEASGAADGGGEAGRAPASSLTAAASGAAASAEAVSAQAGGDGTAEAAGALPPLHVAGTGLADPEGNPVQLRGISTHGLAWFPGYVNEACFGELRREWNANVVRLAMYTAESGGYCTDGDKEQLKQLVRDGVRYAGEQGLYVIVDWHILSDGNPNRYIEEAKAFFAEMSAEFASCSHVLYEICNEPNGGTSWQDIKDYAAQVIPVIRANAPDAVILVGTPTWSQEVDKAAADPITEYGNLLYTLHFYAATHTDALRGRMTAALDAGLPVFVSEYGICDASGNGAIDYAQAQAWRELLDARGVGYVAWNLSNKAETSAMLTPACGKTSGFTQDDLSASGRWVYESLTGAPVSGIKNPPAADSGDLAGHPAGGAEEAVRLDTDTGLSVSAVAVNQWEANGQPVRQYALTVTNNAQTACTQWAVSLNFEKEFVLQDSWNGHFSAQGNVLHITSMDYNGSLAPGGSADAGFILAGGGSLAGE